MGPAVKGDPAVPCPYLASLLAISWSTDLSENESYISGNSLRNGLLDVRDDCWKKTRASLNDEGIAIVDLSFLEAPAYCFIPNDRSPVMTAYEYIRYKMYRGSFTEVAHDAKSPAVASEDGRQGEPEDNDDRWSGEFHGSEEALKYHEYVTLLDVFWSLVELAGYRIIPAEVVNSVWPNQSTQHKHMVGGRVGRQLKVPLREDTPMPLDVVTSLYLGFAIPQELESLRRAFGQEDELRVVIGKAILPPYDVESDKQCSARMSVIYRLLREERAFQFVFEPEWPIDNQCVPPYCDMALTVKLTHWKLEMERRTGGAWARLAGQTATRSADDVVKIARAVSELQSLLPQSAVVKLSLCLAPSIEDGDSTQLDFIIKELDDLSFVDLAFMPLQGFQVTDLMRKYPGVQALSLSHNRHIRADDILSIVTDTPSLKRLHIMGHCPSLDFDRLRELLWTHPLPFRNLESLLTPELINLMPTDCPAAFAFQLVSRASAGPLPRISLPFFTPEQVIRALHEVIPLALRENQYGESIRTYSKDGDPSRFKRLRYGPMNTDYSRQADGAPFYMNASMLLHACFSSGVPSPGTPWCKRPIVSLPFQYHSCFRGRQPEDTWCFLFDWDHTRHRYADSDTNAYAFVYYERVFRDTSVLNCQCPSMRALHEILSDKQRHSSTHDTDSQGQSGVPPSMNLFQDVIPGVYHFIGTAYDLHGFLRCMADEGRPLPSPEVVQSLDRILSTRDPATMEKICRLMTSAEVPHALSASSECGLLESLKEVFLVPELEPVGKGSPFLWAPQSVRGGTMPTSMLF
ncbi:hypothetical protein OH77DRAFT_1430760 [Trametes cingulata]|nr:hypothetical protein OH77DRAFT_1430760 [Trametes cingulata]